MQTTALLAGVENHRVGQVSGDGGLAKIVRTFHARFGSVKMGAGQTPRQRIAYVRREGQHADDAGDVEATAGDKEKVIDAADRLEAGARIKRGPTADRLLATQVIELPAESTPEQRAKCAQAFVDDWRERGHQAIATVHVHGEERKQPHLHVEIAARPVGTDGEVDRAVRLWRGKPTIYAERQKVADLVNEHCEPDPPYHPGGFRDIGREGDTPKKRIPARPFRAARAGIRQPRGAGGGAGRDDRRRGARGQRGQARDTAGGAQEAAGRDRRVQGGGAARAAVGTRPACRRKREAGERAKAAETSVATLTGEKQEAETELATAKKERGEWKENTLEIVKLAYEHAEVDLPDLGTDAGLAAAAEFLEGGAGRAEAVEAVRAEEQEEAGRALTAAKTAWQDERAALAAERDNAKNETATLTDEKQQAETRADTAEKERARERERANRSGREAWRREAAAEKTRRLAGRRGDEAAASRRQGRGQRGHTDGRKQQAEAARAAERQALEQRAGDAEVRVRELEAQQVQPLALTEKQRPMLEDVCARKVWPESEEAVAKAEDARSSAAPWPRPRAGTSGSRPGRNRTRSGAGNRRLAARGAPPLSSCRQAESTTGGSEGALSAAPEKRFSRLRR